MEALAQPMMIPIETNVLLGIADAELGERLARAVARIAGASRSATASSLLELRLVASREKPKAILVDCDLLDGKSLEESLGPFLSIAPVILIGSPGYQSEAARLVAGGEVEFVCRAGNYISLAASLLQRRLRWAALSDSLLGPPWSEFPEDLGTIFRHEINNPLTGILGNAELVLAHPERLNPADTHRLETVVDLAVRLRETVRRLSNAWEGRHRLLRPV
jgi:signal transduction histidine kinase